MICKMIGDIKAMYYRLFYWFFRFNKKKASGAEETDKEASVLAVMLLSAVMFLFVFISMFAMGILGVLFGDPFLE